MDILDGLVWFCWSVKQEQPDGNVTLHLQGQHVEKDRDDVTACGVSTLGYWQFNVQDGDAREWVGCKRCMAAVKKHYR